LHIEFMQTAEEHCRFRLHAALDAWAAWQVAPLHQ
jgi:hypothetical protein